MAEVTWTDELVAWSTLAYVVLAAVIAILTGFAAGFTWKQLRQTGAQLDVSADWPPSALEKLLPQG